MEELNIYEFEMEIFATDEAQAEEVAEALAKIQISFKPEELISLSQFLTEYKDQIKSITEKVKNNPNSFLGVANTLGFKI